MTQIIQAISNHLNQHSIKHDTYKTWIGIYITHTNHSITNIYHNITNNTIQIKVLLQNHTIDQITEINIADPQLFHKILQIAQQYKSETIQ